MTPAPARLPATLWLIPGVYFLFVAAEFVVLTQLALTLTARGASAFAVGALGSAFWGGIFVSSASVPRTRPSSCIWVATRSLQSLQSPSLSGCQSVRPNSNRARAAGSRCVPAR